MKSDNLSESMPCDPASTRRPSVTGPEGVKLATEGVGGVESQAPPAATTTGSMTLGAHPGPVQKPRAVESSGQRKRRLKREAQAGLGGAALNKGGNGQVSGRLSQATATAPNIHRGINRRVEHKERRKREAALFEELCRQTREGTFQLQGMSALPPSLVACMTRIARSNETLASEPQHLEPESAELMPVSTHESAKTNHASTEEPAASRTVCPPTVPEPILRPSKGKGIGKGRKGGTGTDGGAQPGTTVTADNKDSEREDEANRSAKRQRSSDHVSPTSCPAADKKVRLERGNAVNTFVVRTAESSQHGNTNTETENGAGPSSYAEAVKSGHKVIVLDRSRVPMTELRAILVREVIDEALMKEFLDSGGSADVTLPRFYSLPKLQRGGVKYTPRDDYALGWLNSAIVQLPPLWEGSSGLVVVPESMVPRYYTGVIFIPNFGRGREDLARSSELLKNFLVASNPGVGVERWQLFTHEVRPMANSFNHILVMGILPEDMVYLEKQDFRLHYRTARVFVKVRKYRTGGAVAPALDGSGTNQTPGDIDPAPPTPNAGDIALTEDVGWTKEEVDRLLEDGGEDISGDIMGLNLVSPSPSMEADRSEPSLSYTTQ